MPHRITTLRHHAFSRGTAAAYRIGAIGALTFMVLSAPQWTRAATAQSHCAPRAEVERSLAHQYREAPVAAGLSRDGEVVEVYSSNDGETWSLVVTRPDGKSCLVAEGEAWLDLRQEPKGPEA